MAKWKFFSYARSIAPFFVLAQAAKTHNILAQN